MVERLGLIGLGNMGRPIAENFHRKGFSVTVYDIKENLREEMKQQGVQVASSPADLAKRSNIIFLVVNDSKGVGNILFNRDGIVKEAAKGTIIVDMTTSDPQFSKRFSERLQRVGVEYLDSPMTGGATGARNGQLLLMVGGKQEIYTRCLPTFEAISKRAIFTGEVGSGHTMKIIHNHLSHATFLAVCEAVTLGEELGLSLEAMLEVFNQGNARSYATEVRFPKFILPGTYNIGATFATVYKDISIVRNVGKRVGLRLPINNCTYSYWKYAIDRNEGQEDFTRIVLKMKQILSK